MKSTQILTLCFFFFLAFTTRNLPLTLSQYVDPREVLNAGGGKMWLGLRYYLTPPKDENGGGVNLVKTENSNCPLTVVQEHSNSTYGLKARLHIIVYSFFILFKGMPINISFIEDNLKCSSSPHWVAIANVDSPDQKWIGIGSDKDHPGKKVIPGHFRVWNYTDELYTYSLLYCLNKTDPTLATCSNVTRQDDGKNGWRLVLTKDKHVVPYKLQFNPAPI